MTLLWYCLIAKENKPERTYFFTFMIIPCPKRQIQNFYKMARPPPPSDSRTEKRALNNQEVVNE